MKHLNRLEQVLARAEWDDAAIAEGLMLDDAGRVVEGTMSNLFVVSGGRLLTPGLEAAGVAGVIRGLIMDVAPELGFQVSECDLRLADLNAADELFVCNSVIGIWSVREMAGSLFKVGPVAGRFRQALVDEGHIPAPSTVEMGDLG